MNFIKSMDIFGKQVSFDIEGASYFKTKSGGIITILYAAITIYLTYNFGKEIFERNNPTLLFSEKYNEEFPFMNINPKNFALGISIYDSSDKLIDDPRAFYYRAEIRNRTYNRTTDKTDMMVENAVEKADIKLCDNTTLNPLIYSKRTRDLFSGTYCALRIQNIQS